MPDSIITVRFSRTQLELIHEALARYNGPATQPGRSVDATKADADALAQIVQNEIMLDQIKRSQ